MAGPAIGVWSVGCASGSDTGRSDSGSDDDDDEGGGGQVINDAAMLYAASAVGMLLAVADGDGDYLIVMVTGEPQPMATCHTLPSSSSHG